MSAPLILAAIAALSIGVTMGLLGGGGSLLTLPVLVYWLRLDPKQAIPVSQLIVAATSVIAMVLHARAGRVAWRTGFLFSIASTAGAYLGGRLAAKIDADMLMIAFGAVMLLAAAAALFPLFPQREEAVGGQLEIGKAFGIGFPVGVVAGLLGAGGGFLTVPALNLFGGLPMPRAIGTSLLIITLQAVAGFFGQAAHASVDLHLVGVLCAASITGSLLGASLTGKLKPEGLKRGFGVLIALVGVAVLVRQLLR